MALTRYQVNSPWTRCSLRAPPSGTWTSMASSDGCAAKNPTNAPPEATDGAMLRTLGAAAAAFDSNA